jgi:tetratricopeptide (TPR) repeat protein
MCRFVLCAAAALLTLGFAVAPALADDSDPCRNSTSEDRVAACSRLIQRKPTDSGAFYNRGLGYFRNKEYDRAIVDLDQAIKRDPKFATAYFSRGSVYLAEHEYDRAIADYDQGISVDANFAAVGYLNRGGVYNAKHEYDRAITEFDRAIKVAPKFAVAYFDRGMAYGYKGEHDRAIDDYEQAIRLDPNLAVAYFCRGEAYYDKREYDRAIADFDQAIRLNPKFAYWYNTRGLAYDGKGEYSRAITEYDEALRLDPNNALALRNRTRAQAALAAQPARVPTAATPQQISPAITAERRVALVIGNSDYRSATFLPNPRRDANAIADALRQTGFQTVQLATDIDRDGMVKALRTFREEADRADWALVYFAGHGIEINRANYLIPVDAKLADERDINDETVSYEAVLNAVGGAKALRILVLDACRVNPFKERMRPRARVQMELPMMGFAALNPCYKRISTKYDYYGNIILCQNQSLKYYAMKRLLIPCSAPNREFLASD